MRPLLRYPFLGLILLSGTVAQDAPAPVDTIVAKRANAIARTLTLTGTVTSQREARLSTRAEGLVRSVEVDVGTRVVQGDLLMTLDTELAALALEQVRAELATAEVALVDAERQVAEVADLIKSGGFPRTEADARKAAVDLRRSEIATLHVRENLQLEQIARHQLMAPFSGVIAEKSTESGEWVDTGTMVFVLVETDALWFDLQVAQESLAAVRDAEKATVTLDSYPDRPLPAEVEVIVPVKDPVSRTFLTRVTFDDPEGLASPGMSGSATLIRQTEEATSVIIPRDAVVRSPDGKAKVWLVLPGENGEAIARSRSIQTTDALGETVEVTEGLEGGEQIVIRGNEGLVEDQRVQPSEP